MSLLINMAYKGTASKSSSGASMSKYDVEVEARLQALEAAVRELKAHDHPAPAAGGDGGRVDKLIEALNKVDSVTEYFPKGVDGVRRIDV